MEGWQGCELSDDVLREGALTTVVNISAVFQQLLCGVKVPCNDIRFVTTCLEHNQPGECSFSVIMELNIMELNLHSWELVVHTECKL